MQNSEKIWQLVDARKDDYEALSDRVWGMPEIAYTEFRSSAEHKAMLEQEGFRITENLAEIPTAVMGEAGEGGPVIAILGEYDALPGLSQIAGIAEPKEMERGGHGHGCGHNLLGSAALLAATAVKNYLAEAGIKGRVRYYGCPAEEGAWGARASGSAASQLRAQPGDDCPLHRDSQHRDSEISTARPHLRETLRASARARRRERRPPTRAPGRSRKSHRRRWPASNGRDRSRAR